jgi:hypothetical protein
VAHLVNVNRENDTEGKFPTPDAPVNSKTKEHGEKGAGFGQAEEEEFGFGENEDEEELEFPEEESNDTKEAA